MSMYTYIVVEIVTAIHSLPKHTHTRASARLGVSVKGCICVDTIEFIFPHTHARTCIIQLAVEA